MGDTKTDESDIDPDVQRRVQLADALEGTELANSLILPLEAVQVVSTPPHSTIIDHLQQHDPESVTELSQDVGLDQGNTTRYVDDLMGWDVVTLEENGSKKQPRLKHEHVQFAPLY